MKIHVTGQRALGELRHALSAVIFGNPFLLPQEQLLANYRIHESEDVGQLTRWLANTLVAFASRQLVTPPLTISLPGHVL